MSGLTVYNCIIIAQNVHSPNISTLQKKIFLLIQIRQFCLIWYTVI